MFVATYLDEDDRLQVIGPFESLKIANEWAANQNYSFLPLQSPERGTEPGCRMKTLYTSDEVRQLLWNLEAKYGSQRALAEHLGVSAQFLSHALHGRRAPSGALLRALGLKKTPHYEKVN